MRKPIIAIVAAVVAAAVGYAAIELGAGGAILGEAVPGGMQTMTIAEARKHAEANPGAEVVLSGRMDQKCPTAGCWFYLSDDSGRIRVDTQFSGFTVVEQKTGSQVTVYGKLVKPEGGEPEVSALGARF